MSELTVTIRFLDARFHGRGDGGEPEWPPSPMRLFGALLAAGKARWSDELAEAFRWLEAQPPPRILAPRAEVGSPRLTFVPNNNTDSPAQLRTGKTITPMLMPPDVRGVRPEVSYVWPVNPNDRKKADRIKEVSLQVRALGWGIDLAIGIDKMANDPSSSDADPRVTWFPVDQGRLSRTTLRTPSPGSLASLEAAYAQSLARISPDGTLRDDPGQTVFTQTGYGDAPTRPAVAFGLYREDDPEASRRLRPGQIKCLVAMIRRAASSDRVVEALGEGGRELVGRVVLGHPRDSPGPRLSILPLPSIGHPHSDGRIRRVILAEPFDGEGRVVQSLGDLLHGHALEAEHPADHLGVCLMKVDRPCRDGVIRQYTRAAPAWASATPVLLPGYDKRKDHRGDQHKRLARAEGLVSKALDHAGIEQPAQISLSRVPLIPGTDHVRDYRPREKMLHYPRYHVRLQFDRPLRGPLSLGAGRHVGFGVMAAVE